MVWICKIKLKERIYCITINIAYEMLCLDEETSLKSTKKKVFFKFQTLLQNHKFNTLYTRHINTLTCFLPNPFQNPIISIILIRYFFSFNWMPAIKGLIKILHNFYSFEETRIDDMKFECFVSPVTLWLRWLCCPAILIYLPFQILNIPVFCSVVELFWPEMKIISLLMLFLCNSLQSVGGKKGLQSDFL